MSDSYLHSVYVIKDACNGCVACVKYCPTEAIRVRNGKAEIISTRCIDCGECIRRCPTHAMTAVVDTLEATHKYSYNVVLAAPSLYAQFPASVRREVIWQGLKMLGFDEIFDLSAAGDYIAQEIEQYVQCYTGGRKPIISSACPAVLRLIQVKFPELIQQVIPVLSPGEAAAIYVKKNVCAKQNLSEEKVGVWFITPCPAKGTNIRQSVDVKHTKLAGSISEASIYGELRRVMHNAIPEENLKQTITTGSSYGVGWGSCGGEIAASGLENALSVQGVSDVFEVLEQISMNKMNDVDFVELYSCSRGCVGGPFVAINRFVAEKNLKLRIRTLRQNEPQERLAARKSGMTCDGFPTSEDYVKVLEPRPMMQLDEDINIAMEKLEKMDTVLNTLPGIDCGACGAPNCQCLAEDIVQGKAFETDCIFILRSRVKKFAQGMIELSTQIPLTGTTKAEKTKEDQENES
ncbi:MAG: [Fe-Fe] hydrogenase large subunit C-terminal domain-containing protein [Acidaminococcaceae bacterium]|nr:[Fe-Fe] hydrogenase large subunit C-terminal domain-containing protein [Acidaminococcaceae bacterium]